MVCAGAASELCSPNSGSSGRSNAECGPIATGRSIFCDSPGFVVCDSPGFVVCDTSGFNICHTSGFNVCDTSGFVLSDSSGFNVCDPPGSSQPLPPPPIVFGASPPSKKTNGMAVASLVLGIIWIGGIGSVLAVIFGFMSRKKIRQSNGQEQGAGLALAGIILGFIGIVGAIGVALLLFAIGTGVDTATSYVNGSDYGSSHYSSGSESAVCNSSNVPSGDISSSWIAGCKDAWSLQGGNAGSGTTPATSGNTGNTGNTGSGDTTPLQGTLQPHRYFGNTSDKSYSDGEPWSSHSSSGGDASSGCSGASVPTGDDASSFQNGCIAGWGSGSGNTGNTGSVDTTPLQGNTGNT